MSATVSRIQADHMGWTGCYAVFHLLTGRRMASTSHSSRLCTILLLDDDAALRRTIGEFLVDHGYAAHTAESVEQAWVIVQEVSPRVCLVDLNLSDGSGLDLLRRIEQARIRTSVIVMSALPLEHLQSAQSGSHAIEWLTKPVLPATLLATIKIALERTSHESAQPG